MFRKYVTYKSFWFSSDAFHTCVSLSLCFFVSLSIRFELEDVSAQSKVKSSTQRAIKRKVAEQYEPLEPYLDDIIPKGTLQEARCKDKLSIYVVDGEALFFQHRNDPIYPTLKLLHKCKSESSTLIYYIFLQLLWPRTIQTLFSCRHYKWTKERLSLFFLERILCVPV